jgi:hypothetical protein
LPSFPVTHFLADGSLDPESYRSHVAYMLENGPAALFAAGGTGEFFSLGLDEYERIVSITVETAAGKAPVVAGVGYGTAMAGEFARRAERAGADGILLLPPYLVQVEQEGLFRHVDALCRDRVFASAAQARLRRQHRQGRAAHRGPLRGPGSRAAGRSDGRGGGAVGRADRTHEGNLAISLGHRRAQL